MQYPDYNRQMNAIRRVGQKVLLHVCCAPCTLGVMPRLMGFTVYPFYYNPNIDTKKEYDLRAAQFLKMGMQPFICEYDHWLFLRLSEVWEREPEGGRRCRACIAMRLERTARQAKMIGADYFCSTLSVSPHKDVNFINEMGQVLAAKYGVAFLPNDFKKENGFVLSAIRSKDAGLYRQNYCGCEFGRS